MTRRNSKSQKKTSGMLVVSVVLSSLLLAACVLDAFVGAGVAAGDVYMVIVVSALLLFAGICDSWWHKGGG